MLLTFVPAASAAAAPVNHPNATTARPATTSTRPATAIARPATTSTRPATAIARPATAITQPATATTPTSSEAPIPVEASDTPPAGRFLSADRVLEIANRLPKMRKVRAEYPGSYGGAYLKGPTRWQVSYFSRKGKEIGQVIVADHTGDVLEQWTGFQIAWTMARGYPGAFGRHVNALYVWIPLCLLFFVPFFDWRRPLRLLHLDLLVLLSFSVSLAFFNHGRIYVSTPLAYPPLVYLLVRMLAIGRVRLRRRSTTALPLTREQPVRLSIPAPWLAIGLLFLIGFRIGLNVTDSNVIDVGYAGPIGAQRIVQGKSLYGGYPSDNEHGDTYGPVNYEAYVPFEQVFGFSGRWDDLPAAHAAAIAFDLLAIVLLFALGRRIRGPSMGIALAYAWAAYPFTLFALESNSNDSLVAVLVLATLLVASSPPARGAMAALAGLTKFTPLALAPLLCSFGLRDPDPMRPNAGLRERENALPSSSPPSGSDGLHEALPGPYDDTARGQAPHDAAGAPHDAAGAQHDAAGASHDAAGAPHDAAAEAPHDAARGQDDTRRDRRGGGRGSYLSRRPTRARAWRAALLFSAAFAATVAAVSIPALLHDSLHTIYERTLAYQSNRESPFSIWGLYGSSPTGGSYLHWLEPARAAVEGAAALLALALAVLPRREDLIGLAACAAAILIAVQLGVDHWFYLYIPWFFGLAMLALLGQLSWAPQPPPLRQSAASGSARSNQLAAA